MLDLIKKSMLVSIGTAAITRSKFKETLQYLLERGKLTTEEVGQLTNIMVETGEKELGGIREQYQETIKKTLQEMNVANNKDLIELRDKMNNLEKKMDMLSSNRGE